MFWRNKQQEKRIDMKIDRMNSILKKSFQNVKNDTTNIFQWLNYFYKKNMEMEATIKQLRNELSYVPKSREEMRKIVDDYYSFDALMSRMRELNFKVDELSRRQMQQRPQVLQQKEPVRASATGAAKEQQSGEILRPSYHAPELSLIEKRLQKLEERRFAMKERIIKKITKNSKDYVKSVILSYIKKYERIGALQLKEMLVDEQQLCSKSSFYRLLEEIENLDEIGVIKQGKEKHYLHKALAHQKQ